MMERSTLKCLFLIGLKKLKMNSFNNITSFEKGDDKQSIVTNFRRKNTEVCEVRLIY